MLANIGYTNKEALYENANIPDKNKVKADDMNEIKTQFNGAMNGSLSQGKIVVEDIECKNLLPHNIYWNRTYTNVSYTDVDGVITLNGDTGASWDFYINGQKGVGTIFEAGTYTISFTKKSGSISSSGGNPALYVNDDSGSAVWNGTRIATITVPYDTADNTTLTVTFTITTSKKLYFYYYGPQVTFTNYAFTVQCEKGSAATNFTPYIDATPVTKDLTGNIQYVATGNRNMHLYKYGNVVTLSGFISGTSIEPNTAILYIPKQLVTGYDNENTIKSLAIIQASNTAWVSFDSTGALKSNTNITWLGLTMTWVFQESTTSSNRSLRSVSTTETQETTEEEER